MRDALKAKGLLGANDTTVQVLERLDLTNAQKRDERFYPQDAVIVFNQKVREAELGAKGKLAGILKSSVLVEVDGRLVTVSNKVLDRISVCQPRELPVAEGDRLVCDDFARTARHSHFHAGQRATTLECRALRPSSIGDGICVWFRSAPWRPPLGSSARLPTSFRPQSCRRLCQAEVDSSS